MNNKLKILIASITIGITINSAQAGLINIVKKNRTTTMLVVAGGVLYSNTVLHKARHLSYHINEVNSYFQLNPHDFEPIAKYILQVLSNPIKFADYQRYHKLAEVMNLNNIPPYNAPIDNNKPVILDQPMVEQDINDTTLIHPLEIDQFSNIVYTPQGEQLDTSIEFPNLPIRSYEEYIFAKSQAQILADSMNAAGMGIRPKGYATHHIAAWNDNRYAECQKIRNILSKNGIGLNEAENGVYLPTRLITKNNNEAYHPEIHTKEYYENVLNRLEKYDGKPIELKKQLKIIGNELKNNTFKY